MVTDRKADMAGEAVVLYSHSRIGGYLYFGI